MLHTFITENRTELIGRCRLKVAKRFAPAVVLADATHGVPLFLEQLEEALGPQPSTHLRVVGGTEPEPAPAPTKIGQAAALHGAELMRLSYSLDQVVHDYGD